MFKFEKIINIIDNFLFNYLSKFLDLVVMIILGILVLDVFLNICFRYFFNLPIAWSEELAKILLVWLTFIGGAAASRRASHLKIEDILKKFNKKTQQIIIKIINILISILLIILIFKGISMARNEFNQVTDALQISYFYIYIALPVGFSFMLPYHLRNLFNAKDWSEE